MNGLNFNLEYNILKLSPLKLTICNLINYVIKDIDGCFLNFSKFPFFEIFYEISNEYECEVSIEKFFSSLKDKINTSVNENFSPDIYNVLKNEAEKCLSKMQSLNDLYTFFNCEIKDLKTKNENGQSLTENGGLIDYFIRKCLFAFFKLSFEDLSLLFIQCRAYLNYEIINLNFTSTESDLFFDKQLNLLEKIYPSELTKNKVFKQINSKHQAYIESKIKSTINELFCIHHYFDYNMKNMLGDNSNSETKIHYSLMNLVEFYTKNLYYDKAIEGNFLLNLVLYECIKLNQSSCDHEGLLKCFLWMHKIYKSIGNFNKVCINFYIGFENLIHMLNKIF
jgi:hypothetical protein